MARHRENPVSYVIPFGGDDTKHHIDVYRYKDETNIDIDINEWYDYDSSNYATASLTREQAELLMDRLAILLDTPPE